MTEYEPAVPFSQSVTMDDVAARCGIAKSTVSRALSRPEKVSPGTRQRVEQAVRELGYVYNPWASSPGRTRREFLGVMVSQLREMVYTETLNVIDNLAASARYEVLFAVTHEIPQREQDVFLRFKQYRASAIISLGATMGTEDLLGQARAAGIPSLLLWETSARPDVNFIGVDSGQSTSRALQELLRLGHRRIALFVGGSERTKRALERVRGYRRAMDEAGVPYDPQLIQFLGTLTQATGQPAIASCHSAARNVLKLSHPPTALLLPNGYLAVGALSALHEAGLRVPEDVSVLCLGDDDLAASLTPALSCMDTNKAEVHILLSLFLQQVFSGDTALDWRHTLPAGFCARQSCAPRRCEDA